MDIGQIAEAVAASLAPVLPYFWSRQVTRPARPQPGSWAKRRWRCFAEAQRSLGADAAAGRGQVGGGGGGVRRGKERRTSKGARAAWRWQVRKILEADPELGPGSGEAAGGGRGADDSGVSPRARSGGDRRPLGGRRGGRECSRPTPDDHPPTRRSTQKVPRETKPRGRPTYAA